MKHDYTNQDFNLNYYDQNAEDFVRGTLNADVSELYEPFLSFLPERAHVLDLGCGSGRDSLYFKQKGFIVTALDGSAALCQIASGIIGQPVRCQTFDQIDDVEQFDGIWAAASLLHVPEKELPVILTKLHRALKPQGVIYASFKYGQGERLHHGRKFTDCDEERVRKFFSDDAGFEILKIWITNDVRVGREDEKWCNVVGRKRRKNSQNNHQFSREIRNGAKPCLSLDFKWI